jgi:predicted nuclease of predicted toxin-antitoxin system
MWLLDVNVDVRLRQALYEMGIKAESAVTLGWRELTNGKLVAAAYAAGFRVLITRDKLFSSAASHVLAKYPDVAIVIMTLPQRPYAAYLQSFKEAWVKRSMAPKSGAVISWP